MKSPSAAVQLDRPREVLPTRGAAWLFRGKAACFQLQRWLEDRRRPVPRHRLAAELSAAPLLAGHSSDLWMETIVSAERRLQLGKVQNLRAAAARLNGLEIPAGAVWSFWRQVGRTTPARGFTVGRELREGCLIPTIGGGLCQLSGAIYNAALEAGLEVVERHRHSHPGVGTLAALGRDATIFWNYVDLRLRAPFAWRLEVQLTASRLWVRIRSGAERSGPLPRPAVRPAAALPVPVAEPGSCASCGVSQCFRHVHAEETSGAHVAWLVDDVWPEWAARLAGLEERPALLLRPLDGQRWRKANYAWRAEAFVRAESAPWVTLRRAWATRRLREQGAERQRALLHWDEKLARDYAKRLRAEHAHLVVAQNLLPFLWRDGVLGGRTFDVLMSRLPLHALQAALDQAAALYPASTTCADFRAPDALADLEAEALAAATHWLTPHSALAQLAGERAIRLPWQMPSSAPVSRGAGRRIVFPASTLGRKGAYALRSAARELDLEVVCLGSQLEGPNFWAGVRLVPPPPSGWPQEAAAIVLPAFVEHRPRRLLAALAAGLPVIATPACGLSGLSGVTEVPAGDAGALAAAIAEVLRAEG